MAGNSGTEPAGKAHRTSGRPGVGSVGATAAGVAVGSTAHGAQTTGALASDGPSNSDHTSPSFETVHVRCGDGATRARPGGAPGGVDACLDSGTVERAALDGEAGITAVQG